ncbi:hypothetical protein SAMN02745866_04290 [Alteromonadaceae bacterium Bs31]|nr:hypothetical protein SAMN02745866_04290 [Alteromonadaceae bacterium Bs31]
MLGSKGYIQLFAIFSLSHSVESMDVFLIFHKAIAAILVYFLAAHQYQTQRFYQHD